MRAVRDDAPRFIEKLSGSRFKRLFLFGDSHFALHHPVVGVEPRHLGPRTMYRVGCERAALFNLDGQAFEKTDAAGFTFGEIDVRAHFANQVSTTRKVAAVIDDLVEHYAAAIADVLKTSGLAHAVVFSIVPPAGLDYPNFDHAFPRRGTDEERARWTIAFNARLRQMATQRGFGFVDQHTPYSTQSGLLSRDVTVDGLHIQQSFFRDVDWSAAFPIKARDISREGGFLVGWEKALAGNGLSCLSNMFLLSRRTGFPAVYTYSKSFEDLFERQDIGIVDPTGQFLRDGLNAFIDQHRAMFDTEPVRCADLYASIPFEQLTAREVSDEVAFSEHHVGLLDWRENDADDAVRRYCGRGNGLVVTGCYWRQYLDMRELAEDGEALREHLGPLRAERREGRRQRMLVEQEAGVLRVGVHLRLADDYKVWLGGIYHLPLASYVAVVNRLHEELEDKRHTFYLFSDIQLDPDLFSHLPCHYERGAFLDDFIAISSCDYVVGVPSTFASWASFLGRAQRIVLTRERVESAGQNLFSDAIDVPFPNGHYVPSDPTGRTI